MVKNYCGLIIHHNAPPKHPPPFPSPSISTLPHKPVSTQLVANNTHPNHTNKNSNLPISTYSPPHSKSIKISPFNAKRWQ